ncbi:hypothetical protein BEL01nite_57080 [Bradyrhizobium elkanii]|nr:hypothetical protein BEL01nite_57080 [Bradyrhizobium elkanii]
MTGELHRADVLVGSGTTMAAILELQHTSISEDERNAREAFYRRGHRMFWLVYVHNESSFLGPIGHASAPPHWSFGQLASQVSTPAAYLRQLPAQHAQASTCNMA